MLAVCVALAGCVSVRPVDLSRAPRVAQTTLVYDARGRLVVALHGLEDRTPVPLARTSRWLRTAVVDTEDARFYDHDGVDWRAIARAAAHDLERGRVVEGGSTITQQYVKNLYASRERTLRRKLREAVLAYPLERQHAKDEILEAYLNTVYFGEGAYGAEVAARTYFSTGADRLTLPQAALLAGLLQAPAALDPFARPRAALARRAEVLRRMARRGHLTTAQAARAARSPLGLRPGARGARHPAAWFVGWVTDQLLDPADARFAALGATRRERTASLFGGGLRITTTVDLEVQAAAERAVREVLADPARDPYAAVAAVEPGSGAVRAMVGGRDFFADARFGRVNLATGSGGTGRQAGSAFKTFALVAAIERGIPPEAVFRAPDRVALPRPGHGPRTGCGTTRATGSAAPPCARPPPCRSTPSTRSCCCGSAAATRTGGPGWWWTPLPGSGSTGAGSRPTRAPCSGRGASPRSRWPAPTRPWPRGVGARRRSAWPGSSTLAGGSSTRPGPTRTGCSGRRWPRSWTTCCAA